MTNPTSLQLSEQQKQQVIEIVRKHLSNTPSPTNCQLFAFGSRTQGIASSTSDLDLVVQCSEKLPLATYYAIKDDFEYSQLPFRVDFLDWHRLSESFQQQIQDKRLPIWPA